MIRPLAFAVAAALTGAIASQAAALSPAPNAAETIYMEYHKGVHAAVECRKVTLTPQDHMVLEERIVERTSMSAHPARQLHLIQTAKAELNTFMSGAGCNNPVVDAALTRFQELGGQLASR